MVISQFNETYLQGKTYLLNNFRLKRHDDKFLLTTDCGGWAVLEKNEFKALTSQNLSDDLFKILEEKCIILTKNNIEMLLHYYRERIKFLFVGASLHIIVPTLRCNQKCVYCHSSAKQTTECDKDMDRETAIKTLEFIFQTPAKAITIEFQGGDALINFELFKFIVLTAKRMNKIHEKKIRFALVTNLTLMTEDYLRWLCQEKVDICTSLDGPKSIHDANRKYESGLGTYDDVTKWLDLTKNKYKKNVSALMVTTRYSLPHWEKIVDEYVKWGVTSLQIKYINKLGFAQKTWNEIGYTSEEFIDFWKKSVDYMIELNKKGVKIKERYVSIILSKILNTQDPSFLDLRNPCGFVIGQLAYDFNGDIYSCDEGRNYEMFNLGNVKNRSYSEVMCDEKSKNLVSSSITENYACDVCAYKPFCGTCPVLNYAEDNNIIPKLAKNSKCRLVKAQFDYIFDKLIYDSEVRSIFYNWENNWKYNNNNKNQSHKNIKEKVESIYEDKKTNTLDEK